MLYHFFLDETGDHGLNFIDPNFPLFLLAGCLFSDEELKKIKNEIEEFKKHFFGTMGVIMHSRDIRKCEGSFQILFDLEIKKEFYVKLNKILSQSNFTIIGAGVDKDKHIKTYGKNAQNPYEISLSFILERLIFCLNKDQSNKVNITIERRGKREDTQLLEYYNRTKDSGTYYVGKDKFKECINKFDFVLKRDNVIGLQVADLCAYPLARHILNKQEPYVPFQIIKDKIYCNLNGKYDGYGLKTFP